jgi:hypothetical protein
LLAGDRSSIIGRSRGPPGGTERPLGEGDDDGCWEQLRSADERDVFLVGFTAFVVVGTKPGAAESDGQE